MGKCESLNACQANLHEQFLVDRIGPHHSIKMKYRTDNGTRGMITIFSGLRLTPTTPIDSSKGEVNGLMDKAVELCEPICSKCPLHELECRPGLHNGNEEGTVVLYVGNDLNKPFPNECPIGDLSNPTSP